ncbi:MAG: GNAT family N-acetyltransferase [Candidatus Heimdallarchaeota archaeon]|nr:GNAT family N-acetyltransferase [Candidatus Heimdallarchaeota archaeon]
MYYGEKVVIRGLELSDTEELLKYWNDLELRRFLFNQLPNSKEEEEEFIRSTWSSRKSNREYLFAVDTLEGVFIGTTGLSFVDPINRAAVFGIAIFNKEYWGKGYGTDITRVICGFGFNILNIHSIRLDYLDGNEGGKKAYTRVGFKEVGRLRQSIYRNGSYTDRILMDILKDEFNALNPNFTLTKKE